MDPRFRAPHPAFQILDSGVPTQCIPDFKRPRFQNFIVSRIPDSKVHDSVQKLPGFCNPYYLPWGEINKIDISMNLILAISLSASFYCRWSFGVVLWELATMGKLVNNL